LSANQPIPRSSPNFLGSRPLSHLSCSQQLIPCPNTIHTHKLTHIIYYFSSVHRYYAVVHPINAKVFSSKRRTIKIIASTWTVAVILALPYLYCKSYAFSISSHLGSISRYICTDRFDDIDIFMYGGSGSSLSSNEGNYDMYVCACFGRLAVIRVGWCASFADADQVLWSKL